MKLALVVLPAVLATLPAWGDELKQGRATAGMNVHDPAIVLAEQCTRDADGRLWFTLPGGLRFELITSTSDPEIVNPGDGSFHPFDAMEVNAAIRSLDFALEGIAADVYLLPYPRRGALRSAAGPGLILLSPGVRPLAPEHQHAEVVHELGHVVQYARMPDADHERWTTYRSLRGIVDLTLYRGDARHENRPHEIFAEDFRVLFGGALAAGSGAIENAALIPPAAVPGLREFMAALATTHLPTAGLVVSPQPARGMVQLRQQGGSLVTLDVYDGQGRRVATLEPRRAGADVEWVADASQLPPGAQVLFARPRTPGAPAVRIIRIP